MGGGCAIRVAPDGKTVYTSHQTDDSIVVFSVDESSGALKKVQAVPCGGVTARDMQIFWQDRRLVVCNQDTQNVASFSIDAEGKVSSEPTASLATPGICPGVLSLPVSPPAWVDLQ